MNFELATFVIAVLSLVLAVLSLGWQAATFFLEGGRVRADFSPGFANARMAVTVRADQFTLQATIDSMRQQGFPNPVAAVRVRNVGRLPVTVARWTISTKPRGAEFEPVGQLVGPELPHRLEGGESAMWVCDYQLVFALMRTNAAVLEVDPARIRARSSVGLGDGRTVHARGEI